MSNELPQEDKERIAKIDEWLKKLEILLDEALSKETPETLTEWIVNKRKCEQSYNEQSDKEEYVECIDNSDCEDVLIKGKVYKVNLEDETWIYVTDEEEDNENYSKHRFKPSTKEAYLKQFLPDNEQQAPVDWKKQIELNKKLKPLNTTPVESTIIGGNSALEPPYVPLDVNYTPVEWKVGHCGENSSIHKDNIPELTPVNGEWKPEVGKWVKNKVGLIGIAISQFKFDSPFLVDMQNGQTFDEYEWNLTKPIKEEIEQHLVKIAEKKYPVGTTFKGLVSEDNEYMVIDHNFKYYDNGETQDLSLYGYMVWRDGKWAESITEQKERWKPKHGVDYYHLDEFLNIIKRENWNLTYDVKRIEVGNCFKTKPLAERAAQAIRETLKNL